MTKIKLNQNDPGADVVEIEEGRFLVSFTAQGIELLKASASYYLADVPPEELAGRSLASIIEENLSWALYEYRRGDGHLDFPAPGNL